MFAQRQLYPHIPVWKQGVSKRVVLKSLTSDILKFKSWIKLIYDKITYINEFNPAFEVQNMGYKTFQNASFSKREQGKELPLG